MSVIDTAANTVVGGPTIIGVLGGFTAEPSPDGRHLYLATNPNGGLSTIDTATGKITGKQVTLGSDVDAMTISPEGDRLYVVAGKKSQQGVLTIDTATLKTVGRPVHLDTGLLDHGPHGGLAISPDGGRVYVSNLYARTVSVIDTTSLVSVGAPVKVGGAPVTVTVGSDNRVYAALYEGKIATFKTDNPDAVQTIDLAAR